MESKKYVSESIKTGWRLFKSQPWLWVGITLLVGLPNIISGFIEPAEGVAPTLGQGVGMFVLGVLSFLFSLGLIKASLDAVTTGEKVELSDIWSVYDKRVISIIGAHILAFLILVIPIALTFWGVFFGLLADGGFAIGIAAVIIGAIAILALSIKLFFVQYSIIDTSMTAVNGIKQSFSITKGKILTLIGFLIVLGALNFVGALLLLIGLLVTVPVTSIATAAMYRSFMSEGVVVTTDASDVVDNDEESDKEPADGQTD